MRHISPAELVENVSAIFLAAGSFGDEAHIIADHLVGSNLAGHDSHGVIRVRAYLEWLRDGKVHANRSGSVVGGKGACITYDGQMGYGQIVGYEAMRHGIARAKEHGVALVAIRNSGHLGRIGAWAEQVAAAGFISTHWVNTSGLGISVAAFGGTDRRLSANPIAVGAPVPGGEPIILDISTSIIAEGKIQVARAKGVPLPAGAILDKAGQPSTDPADFYAGGALMTFGGHKGYGLSVFCEILAGSLTGGASTHPDNASAHQLVNNMTSFIVDPAAVNDPGFYAQDVTRLCDWLRAAPPAQAGQKVKLPGDTERESRLARQAEGVPLDDSTYRMLIEEAARLGANCTL